MLFCSLQIPQKIVASTKSQAILTSLLKEVCRQGDEKVFTLSGNLWDINFHILCQFSPELVTKGALQKKMINWLSVSGTHFTDARPMPSPFHYISGWADWWPASGELEEENHLLLIICGHIWHHPYMRIPILMSIILTRIK